MKKAIIGRVEEIQELEKYLTSGQSEFIAVYGRRRVGKTFLIKELFEGKFTFRMTGRENALTNENLMNFAYALNDFFQETRVPKNWSEAFRILSKNIEKLPEGEKIIFIDELPWCDTSKSGFIGALEHFWNDWAYYRKDIKLIVCGSATSWMLEKLINSRGGLHNRVTHKMLISPFNLKETEMYFRSRGFRYERQECLDCYMAFGGIAYYLSLFDRDKSVAENINALCFAKGGDLRDEFERLYDSLFKKSDNHIAVITALGECRKGMTRNELIDKLKIPNNGNLTALLNELEACEIPLNLKGNKLTYLQKLQVYFCRLLLEHPKLLICEELFANEDPDIDTIVLGFLEKTKKAGTAVLLLSSGARDAGRICDRQISF